MSNANDIHIVLCTVPDTGTGQRIASRLVEYRLAACVNLLPAIQSVYRWQGAVHSDEEALLMIKARAADYPELEAAILESHPYELPEIIAVPLAGGLPRYLDWIVNPDEAK
jgi:periplasmic divalent cation tolerance protein